MKSSSAFTSIYLWRKVVDFRKSINGLSAMVQEEMQLDPYSSSLFIFCCQRRKKIKILYRDRTGFSLWYKKLEEVLFPWPMDLVPAHEHKRGRRLKLPENLPRVEVVIDIDDKLCPEDGKELKFIGEEVSEKLEIIPAKIRVIKTIRKKYSCPACDLMKEALAPVEMIPKSNASASVLAYIATAKYVDSLPLYRQEAIFKRV